MDINEKFLSGGLSRFSSLRDTRPVPTTWGNIFKEITDGTHAAATLHYRNHLAAKPDAGDTARLEQWKLTKSRLKAERPAFTPSVILEGGRTKAHVKGFTNLVMVDVDDQPAECTDRLLALLKADKHAVLVYRTLSGRGIRVIARVEGEMTAVNFYPLWKGVNTYYADLCGVSIDEQCKNATRMSVICHDPDALFRPDAEPFPAHRFLSPAAKSGKKKGRAGTVTPERAYRAIKPRLDEEGVTYAPGNYNAYVSRCLYLMNRYGVPRTEAEDWVCRTFQDYPRQQLLPMVASCYAHIEEHGTEALPRVRQKSEESRRPRHATVEEMEAFLHSKAEVRFNLFTRLLELRPKDGTENPAWQRLSDYEENSLWCEMNRNGMNVNINNLHTLLMSDFVEKYHPLQHYLDSLPAWDGETDYIHSLSGLIHPDRDTEADLHEVFKRWLVGMLAGALDNEVVNQTVLILVGPQGSYKTTFMQHILPPALSEYYMTKGNSQHFNKDDLFTMTEKLVINLEEIETMTPDELNKLKAMISQPFVDERPAYGRNKVHRPHIASFVATTNSACFLADHTGNRRFIPFLTQGIDDARGKQLPYEGIYAQAYALLKSGFRYWFTNEEIHSLRSHVSRFEVPKPENELILTYFRKPVGLERCTYVTASQIVARFSSAGLKLSLARVGRAMRELGFESVHTREGNFWIVVERTSEEVRHVLPEPAEAPE